MLMTLDLVALCAVVLSMSIPIIAIIAGIVSHIKKNNNDREIRRLIIENHIDSETAKMLIEEPEKKQGTNPYPALRWGCILIGLGLGALLTFPFNLHPFQGNGQETIYFWVMLACGCGLGLLCSFLIEWNLQKHNAEKQELEA